MKKAQEVTKPVDQRQLAEVAGMTPFPAEQLQGQQFARGNMLGGAVPVQEAKREAPWVPKE